jgi:hypothetical protein
MTWAPAVALAGQGVGSALVALAAEERVELVLNGALDDQLRAEAGQLGQRAFGVRGGALLRRAGRRSGTGSPSTAVRCVSRRRSPFLVLQD